MTSFLSLSDGSNLLLSDSTDLLLEDGSPVVLAGFGVIENRTFPVSFIDQHSPMLYARSEPALYYTQTSFSIQYVEPRNPIIYEDQQYVQ